ncbi:unnamed protein product [Diabrotica balteata]|uniref:Uncharacterized protein n=1 Tax=Diabrotica balteata TaxID=107213 RepID=A0A9N9XCF0_DIABA|nr:unnamed protein product [Diabrotica balteata]
MEINQEVDMKHCKIEIDNETCVGALDVFKIEIKEEPKTETAYHSFDYLNLNEFTVKNEVQQREDKIKLFEEKQPTNEENMAMSR